jgi:large subunit ribosomal protein L22
MEVRSTYKYARISSQKARQVTRAITGMPVSQALSVLDFTPKKAKFFAPRSRTPRTITNSMPRK